MFFAHRPPPGSDVPFKFSSLLEGRGEPYPLWEVQIQGRFKVQPSGTIFLGFELWDGPMQLGFVARSMCQVIIQLGGFLARKRDTVFDHSFGNSNGEKPKIAFPACAADRIFLSDSPVPLPIESGSDRGVWRIDKSSLSEVDRASLVLGNPDQYITFLFATPHIDWASWTVPNIPGFGCMGLEKFWGPQSAHVVMYDKQRGQQRLFTHMKITRPGSQIETAESCGLSCSLESVLKKDEAQSAHSSTTQVDSDSQSDCTYFTSVDEDDQASWADLSTTDEECVIECSDAQSKRITHIEASQKTLPKRQSEISNFILHLFCGCLGERNDAIRIAGTASVQKAC